MYREYSEKNKGIRFSDADSGREDDELLLWSQHDRNERDVKALPDENP